MIPIPGWLLGCISWSCKPLHGPRSTWIQDRFCWNLEQRREKIKKPLKIMEFRDMLSLSFLHLPCFFQFVTTDSNLRYISVCIKRLKNVEGNQKGFMSRILDQLLDTCSLASSWVPLACIPLKEMDQHTNQHVCSQWYGVPCTSISCHVFIVIGPNKLVRVARIVGRPCGLNHDTSFHWWMNSY